MAYSKEFILALTKQVFMHDDGAGFHDAIFEATGISLSDDDLRSYFGEISQYLQTLALQWGMSDTVFKDEVYELHRHDQLLLPTKYRSTVCS